MRSLDFEPFARAAIGFDRVFAMLDDALHSAEGDPGYPLYNIKKTGDDAYCLEPAAAGFAPQQLSITAERDVLIVRGRRLEGDDVTRFYQGITAGNFERRFSLADYIKVTGARLIDGILSIDLARELPEAMKPRTIPIAAAARAIEHKSA